jgi:glycine cleavage system regulatory protein
MTMTRKHFEGIAELIKGADLHPEDRAHIINRFCQFCKGVNFRFDADKFTEACTPEGENS